MAGPVAGRPAVSDRPALVRPRRTALRPQVLCRSGQPGATRKINWFRKGRSGVCLNRARKRATLCLFLARTQGAKRQPRDWPVRCL